MYLNHFLKVFKSTPVALKPQLHLYRQAMKIANALNVAKICFFEDANVIARLNVSSNDLDSIFIPFLIVIVMDAHIFEHNL